jgi:hypothetical protein
MDILGVGSHQQVLLEAIRRSGNKPILELGAGDYSTPLIHEAAKGRYIVTTDHSKMWLSRYWKLECKSHAFLLMDDDEVQEYYKRDTTNWGVVFVDSITWDVRVPAIQKYKDTSDYLVIHDTGYSAQIGVFGKLINGIRDFSDWFKYWVEYLPINNIPEDPPTVLGSNFFLIEPKEIEGMVVINCSV